MVKDEFFDLPHHRGQTLHNLIIPKAPPPVLPQIRQNYRRICPCGMLREGRCPPKVPVLFRERSEGVIPIHLDNQPRLVEDPV
jgi:hypothetical protein